MTRGSRTSSRLGVLLLTLLLVGTGGMTSANGAADRPVSEHESPASVSYAADSRPEANPTVFFTYPTTMNPTYVVRPGMRTVHRVGLTPTTKRVSTVWIRYGGFCHAKAQDRGRIIWWGKGQKLRVPGDPQWPAAAGKTTMLRFPTITVPSGCDPIRKTEDPAEGHFEYELSTSSNFARDSYGRVGPLLVMGRNSTDRNRRHNLLLANKPKGAWSNYQAHHRFPREFASWFHDRGIDSIHQAAHLKWWCSKKGLKSNHQSRAKEYNDRWRKFKNANKNASLREIFAFRDRIERDYKFTC